MRIALVVERFEPGSGGVESVVFQVAAELARRAQQVTVVCRRAGAPAPEGPPSPEGVRVEVVRVPAAWQPLRVGAFSRRAARATGPDAPQRFDVVHSFARTRRQQIYRAGGGSHAAYMERVYPRPAWRRLSPRHRAILAIEEAVFRDERQLIQCNAHHVETEIRKRYGVAPERLVTLYNGVDTERFHPRTRQGAGRDLRAALGLDGPLALFVGSGFRRKGLDRAIAALAAGGVKADLLVAGRGDTAPFQRQAAKLGVDGRVHFLGERRDVDALMAAADLFVLPTRYDPFSNACLEAMAAGLPVATTRANGAAELVEPGENGFLLEEEFAPAFEALADRESLRELGRAARRAAEGLTWQAHVSRLLPLYERVAR